MDYEVKPWSTLRLEVEAEKFEPVPSWVLWMDSEVSLTRMTRNAFTTMPAFVMLTAILVEKVFRRTKTFI